MKTVNFSETVAASDLKGSRSRHQGQIISLTGLSALSIALWKPNVIVSSLALDFESEENRKVISM